ncbi:fumarylacetoacetate hydrolase family protein [Egicoccus sp. AB-alg2]|uniref:fumarylacetoacetate hydrolase family protein n=1 Tax=Egicoccus sp. AB-alg2 TaxID=3242693 RepID=UPI00359ECA9F
MRFVTVEHAGRTAAGVLDDGRVYLFDDETTVLDLVRSGLEAAKEAGASVLTTQPAVPFDQVRLRPPLQPPTLRDFVAFEEHVEGIVKSVSPDAVVVEEWYAAPTFYFTNPHAIVGPGDEVAVPPGCRELDFELEVAAVVGRDGTTLAPAEAEEHIFGYTILNDWSARDLQRVEMRVGLGPAKGKDFASSLGPSLVTADELETFRDADGFLALALTVTVNGEEIGRDLASNMGWPFRDLVAYASRGTWVRAGDVLGSGTCGNGGCLAELWGRRGQKDPPALQPGDVVELNVEGLGTLTNIVVAGRDAPAIPPARRRPRSRP